jgi:osmoprotectant transport system ATP-binding protein
VASQPATGTQDIQQQGLIRLEELTKRFSGQKEAAVDRLSIDIPAGEIVILVGPSGCGKTTSLRLMNRLIEPTEGRIIFEGQDVTHANPDELRRRMGYVIQQVGLFPHMTIADNIAVVPRMLGWSKQQVSKRVDELLQTVDMDPSAYRGRYPKELSGGQQQRVGVARAMAADPPVLLMDEPFGALDPITRDRLQNEFLRLQAEIQKTIVFVTHDIDEAIKMGDRIAILQIGSKIAQYDTPARILADPADEFVENFIGSGASLKGLSLTRVADIQLALDWPTASTADDQATVRRLLGASERESVLALDEQSRPRRWITESDLQGDSDDLAELGVPAEPTIDSNATLHDVLDQIIASYAGAVIVVASDGTYEGMVDLETLMQTVSSIRQAAKERREAGVLTEAPKRANS